MTGPKAISDNWRRMGDEAARDPLSWQFAATPLLRGAELCWQRYEMARDEVIASAPPGQSPVREGLVADLLLLKTAVALVGQGLEVLLKALIVQRDPNIVDSGASSFYTHNLVEQARGAGLVITSAERDLLERLREVIEWSGRYPIPKWNVETGKARFDVTVVAHEGTWAIDGAKLPGAVTQGLWPQAILLVNRALAELKGRGAA